MSERGISYRQSWLRQVMDGKVLPAFPETKALLSRDSLLDATLTLFSECEQRKRTNYVTSFVKKYKDAVSEIQQARVVPADFEVLDLIGRGQFGKVELVRAKYGACNTFYALKTVPKKVASDSTMAMSIWEERDILVHANSPWLTQAHYAFQDDVNLYLVMDYVPGGDLYSLMRRQEDLFTECNVRFYFVEILLCINAVHHMGYVHRDIKPENILLDQRGHLKLVDFGSAVRIGSLANGHCVGTASYMSPEALQAADPDFEYQFGPEVDFWALGIVLYEMLYYRNPFISDEENESSIEIIRNIMDWRNSLIFDDDIFQISDTCRSLITNLVTDREQRFGFKEISQHPFLGSVGISQIGEKTPPFIPQVSGDADTSNFEPPVPGLSHSEGRYGRKSFAGGDSLSQVAFIGYTYSSVQSCQGRKTRARTSLALEGIPVSTLERKWADRNNDLRMRCQDLERQVAEFEEKLKRVKPTQVDAVTWTSASETNVAENRKDEVSEKSLKLIRPKEGSFADKVEKKLMETFSQDTPTISGDEILTTNQLRQDNLKLKRLISGLNVEIEEQRNRLRQYKLSVVKHSEAETRARERARDLELRLRTLTRRRSMQSRKVEESLADEHRQMLTTIQEQADSIAQLEAKKQSLENDLTESKQQSETLQEELRQTSQLQTVGLHNAFDTPHSKRSDSGESKTEQHEAESPKHVKQELPQAENSRVGMMTPCKGKFPNEALTPVTPAGAASASRLFTITSTPMFCDLQRAAIFNESLIERDRAVIELTNRVSELLSELHATRTDQKEVEHRCWLKEEEMKVEITSYETRLNLLKQENETLQRKYERMCIEKIEKYDENRKLKKTISQLESQAQNLKIVVDELRMSESETQNTADESRRRLLSLETETRDLKASNESLQVEKNDLMSQLRTTHQRLEEGQESLLNHERELAETVSKLQQQRDVALSDAREKKMALSEVNALLSSAKQRERSAKEEGETMTRQLEEMRSRLFNAERNVTEHGETAARVAQQEETIQKMEKQLKQESDALQAAEINLQDVNAKLENSRLKNDILQERVKELESVEQKCRGLTTELTQLRQLHRSKEDKCDSLDLKLQQVVSQLETERSMSVNRRAQDAAESGNKLNELRARLRTELNESKSRCGELESKVAKLNIEVSQMSRDKQDMEGEIATLKKRLTSSEEEALRLKEECAQHITAMQDLRRENINILRDVDAAEDSYDAMSTAKSNLEAQLHAQMDEFSVERLRYTSTIQQQAKLIDMLQGNAENMSSKRKGIKHLFSGNSSRSGFSGPSVSSAVLQALQNTNVSEKSTPSKQSTIKNHELRM